VRDGPVRLGALGCFLGVGHAVRNISSTIRRRSFSARSSSSACFASGGCSTFAAIPYASSPEISARSGFSSVAVSTSSL
jgi:hypothetical protein